MYCPRVRLPFLAFCFSVALAGPALAQACQNKGNFEDWLDDFKREAAAAGISQRTIAMALNGVSYDPRVIQLDRGQRVFKQSFEQFSARMVSGYRLKKGAALLKQYAGTLERIEQQYGVPGEVVVAIWGLETDFGGNSGNMPTIRSLATLAYDCRRSELFTTNLLDALRILDRGDLTLGEMRGAWAGELGQTQFMASNYVKYAVDFDGNGRRDLIRNPSDVLASTANYLKGHGWVRGGSFSPGGPNYPVLQQWNKSSVYTQTVAYFASRLANGQ